MAPRLGIVAGGGPLPGQLVAACRRSGRDVFVLALEGFTDPANLADVPHAWVRLGAAGKAIAALHGAGVEEVVLAGPVRRPTLADLRPDLRAMRFLARGVLNRGDDGLLRAIVRVLEDEEGFRVIGVGDIAGDLLPGPGALGRHEPDAAARGDVQLGVAVVRAVGRL
ncbi:MAG: LpxI family protein, partial [Alphaproteobacteria bacterium]|nr:LpxI family protein [Alphaproteobacteria bacterium]